MALLFIDAATRTLRPADLTSAQLRVDDLAVTRGEGIFETLLVDGGVPRQLDHHLDRLAASARALALDLPPRDLFVEAIGRVAASHVDESGSAAPVVVRVFVSAGVEGSGAAEAWVTGSALPDRVVADRRDGVRATVLSRGYPDGIGRTAPWLLAGAKTISYAINMAMLRHAREAGFDDAIVVSESGHVLEAPTANVIAQLDGALVTPDPALGLLHGTTQRELFARAEASGIPTRYATLTVDDLVAAEGVWLVSSLRLAAPVTAIDARALTVERQVADRVIGLLANPTFEDPR